MEESAFIHSCNHSLVNSSCLTLFSSSSSCVWMTLNFFFFLLILLIAIYFNRSMSHILRLKSTRIRTLSESEMKIKTERKGEAWEKWKTVKWIFKIRVSSFILNHLSNKKQTKQHTDTNSYSSKHSKWSIYTNVYNYSIVKVWRILWFWVIVVRFLSLCVCVSFSLPSFKSKSSENHHLSPTLCPVCLRISQFSLNQNGSLLFLFSYWSLSLLKKLHLCAQILCLYISFNVVNKWFSILKYVSNNVCKIWRCPRNAIQKQYENWMRWWTLSNEHCE